MASKDDTIESVIETPIVHNTDPAESKQLGWRELFNLLMFESTEHLREKKLKELQELATSQSEISFLSNLRSILMIGANPNDGTFEINDQLKALLNKVSNSGSESLMAILDELGLKFTANYSAESFSQLFSNIEALPSEERRQLLDKLNSIGIHKNQNSSPSQEQLEELVKLATLGENMKLRKFLMDNGIMSTKDKFTKAERESLIESIHVNITQKQGIHGTKSQMVLHMETLIHQMQERVPDLQKTIKRVIDKMLDAIRSR